MKECRTCGNASALLNIDGSTYCQECLNKVFGDSDPSCGYCRGSGHVLWHADWCKSSNCNINENHSDCGGQIISCDCHGGINCD